MNRFVFAALVLALAGGALAQPAGPQGQPDPAFLQKALSVLQQQRNNAQDQLAAEQARRLMVEEENAKLQQAVEAAKKPAPAAEQLK